MKRKLISMLLCTAILSSAVPAVTFADNEPEVTAGLKATLRFDYPQTAEKVLSSNIKIKMYREGDEIGEIPLDGEVTGEISENTSTLKKNTEGGVLENETEIGYFDVNISNLELGNYSFKLTGTGYSDYETKEIELDNYSRQVVLGTGDKTFSIGDVNNDGKVDTTDRKLVSDALGTNNTAYDLNGDGKVNIVDLAYVNHQIGNKGDVELFDTALIAQKAVNTKETENNVNVLQGEVSNIFNENNNDTVVFGQNNHEPISIPIEFHAPTEMEQIEVVSPDVKGALTAGTAEITYTENGKDITEEVHFNNSVPENVLLLSENEETKTVVISLGKRVAVKKIIINVKEVQGEEGVPTYTVVQEVKFLKDIVPENPVPQVLTVRNVTAEALNESVKLKWDEFPNISGYKILYGLESDKLTEEMSVDVNEATITGLKNLKTYYFTVIPTSDDWEGGRSELISAIPQPNSVPLKPDMITVTPMDGALSLGWKETENATYYRVFYKKETDTDFTEIPAGKITEPKAVIGGLTNKTVYHLYVVAGNSIGEGPKSDLTEGIPDKFEVEAPKIPTLHQIDRSNIESVVMTNPNNVKKDEYPNGFDVWNVADGDYATHWTARVFWESTNFTFTFKEAKEMNYMVYVPRLDGNYRKSLARYSITVWDEEGNEKQLVSGKNIAINSTETGYMILPFEKTTVKKLAVSLAQWDGSPTGVSLSEAIFYESDNLESEVRGLFANDTYTELSASAIADKAATMQKIESLRAQANDSEGYYVDKDVLLDELQLAEDLLENKADALGRVKNGIESRSTGADSAKYKQAGSDLQPLGVVAYATDYAERNKFDETKVTIYAHIPENETVYVVPTQYYAEANAWQGAGIPLQNGRNIIEIPKIGTQTSERGGSLYLKYSGSKPEEISLQIRQGAIAIPMLELADWYNISETERKERIGVYVDELSAHTSALNPNNISLRIANSTEISMPNVLLSVAAQPVLNAVKPTNASRDDSINTLYNNVLAWEDMMHIVNTTQGIDNTYSNSDMQSRQNIRYMRMFAKAFMYAAGSHIGIGYGSVGGMSCGKPVSMMAEGATANNIFGWGIAHEIGHNMDKLGKAEITNNIYSIMAQTYDGKQNTLPSRLEKSNKYTKIYDKVSAGRPGMSNDVFVQLGMYWQLHLAYDEGENSMDFYNRLFKEWKSGTITAPTSDERFALVAAKIANKNLTEFFTSWGMVLSDETKAELKKYPEETRKLQYLCDESRRFRLNGGNAANGTTTAQAVLDSENEKQINLTFSNSAAEGSILGYEIKRNGKSVAFVTDTSYTDIIGSANNTAFRYSVQAIDMLGNKVGEEADAGQVRISYVKTIDKDSYTETRNADGSIKVVFNKKTSVSGVKITNAPSTGNYTVSVTNEAGETITAKNGDFAVNETPNQSYYVSYFNKPNTTDTRIWTYDANEITVTGISEGVTVEYISYAGDNIEFTSDAAVGKLKNDYVYDNGEGGQDTIAAGTIIVTGTYRGDPLYNTIQINGSFVSVNPETNEETVTERAIDGYALMFAEIPEDGEVSDISDGIFIFVPDVQKEAELQGKGDAHDCSADSLLPAQIKAEMYRTDTIESTESKRKTSDTIWIDSPSYNSMPDIILEGEEN